MYPDLSPNGCAPPQPATVHGAHASSFLLDCNAWSNSCEHALITHSCLEPASRGLDQLSTDPILTVQFIGGQQAGALGEGF